MLRHVVLLDFRPDTSSDAIDILVDALRALPDQIESIVGYQVGTDLGFAADNAQVAVVAEFADRAGWDSYQQHPAHQQVIADLVKPHLAGRSASQFTI
ncbi:MAG: Dabb family protein [Acidimicrobiales bacterium]